MKITAIRVYRFELPIPGIGYKMASGAGYKMSRGRTTTRLENTVVELVTDSGITGWGESCPFGANYLIGFAKSARAAIEELAPFLIGRDPRATEVIGEIMDTNVFGHEFAKSAIDMACWDILGKSTSLPVYMLLGGKRNAALRVRTGVTDKEGDLATVVAERRKAGFTYFSVKLGDDPAADIEQIRAIRKAMIAGEMLVIDANGGWRLDEALMVAHGTDDLPQFYFEQPCELLDDCIHFARRVRQPVMFDEGVADMPTLVRVLATKDSVGLNLKLERVGGLTKARKMADLAIAMGCPLVVQEVGGAEITQAATVHLAHAVPERFLLGTSYPKIGLTTAKGAPKLERGRTWASDAPGLGVTPIPEVVGKPVSVHK